MRIVIGDDHALVRDGLRPWLRQLGPDCTIVDAGSYAEVLAGIGGGDAALVIIEPRMGDMPPLAGIEAVRRAFVGRLALLTAITDPALISELMARGANGFIPKRLGIDAVVSALRLILAGETFLPASMVLGAAAAAAEARSPGLTGREHEVLLLLREGLSNKGIARRLDISEVTVKSHLANAFRKLGVKNGVQAAQAWMPPAAGGPQVQV